MRLLLTTEERFSRDIAGEIYADGPSKYPFWSRYLEVFDEVLVVARVRANETSLHGEARANGRGVSFWPLPDYRGPWQYLRRLPELSRQVRIAAASCDAYILRVPGLIGRLVWHEIERLQRPYGLKVAGDPWDALGPKTWPSVFRPAFRRIAARELRCMCDGAVAIQYVTEKALQRRYPPGKNVYAVGFSDALMDSVLADLSVIEGRTRRLSELRSGEPNSRPLRIGFIGSLALLYKGPDLLLQAASLCLRSELDFELVMVGEGRYAVRMEALARQLGISERTRFIRHLPPGNSVFQFLDSVDLFVMPSRAEGLPRAMIEAMARGCPCIGSDVGGIPELLAREDLVPSGNAEALASKILEVGGNPQRLKAMSERNLVRAADFNPDKLRSANQDFCRMVRIRSEEARNIRARIAYPSQSLAQPSPQSRPRSAR